MSAGHLRGSGAEGQAIRQNLRPHVAQSSGTAVGALPSSLYASDPPTGFLPAYPILVITKHEFVRN